MSFELFLDYKGNKIGLPTAPQTFSQLKNQVYNYLNLRQFQVTYKDLQSDQITIKSDIELLQAFEEQRPLILKVTSLELPTEKNQSKPVCEVCKKILQKHYFICPLCNQTLICPKCKDFHPHHTIRTKNSKVFNLKKKLGKSLSLQSKWLDNIIKLDMLVLQGNSFNYERYLPGQNFVNTWLVKNNGKMRWSSPCYIIQKHNPQIKPIEFPTLKGKQQSILTVPITAPLQIGEYTLQWIIRTPLGVVTGDSLIYNIKVVQSFVLQQDLDFLSEFGLSTEQSTFLLQENRGNLEKVVNSIFEFK